MAIKWIKKQHRFSFQGKNYVVFLSKPRGGCYWYAQYKEIGKSHLRNLDHYTTTAHAVRGIKRDINSRRKRTK